MSSVSEHLNPLINKLFKANGGFGTNKIFLAKQLQNVPTNDLFPQKHVPPTGIHTNLVNKFQIANSKEEADFILVPHEWVKIYKNRNYFSYLQELSKTVPLVILNTGDVSPEVKIRNVLELRTFLHPWENLNNKIIIPYPTKPKPFHIRTWTPIPTISFMGYVPKLSLGALIGKNARGIKNPIKSSVYINRKLGVLRLNNLKHKFNINVTTKENFTAYNKNPNLLLDIKNYEESLANSDYILCPRGFGNTSIRFYECLSAGRTPIVINSNGRFPFLDKEQEWSEHILEVNILSDWESVIKNDWDLLQKSSGYEKRQIKNNKLFITNLEFNVYLTLLFKHFLK